MRKYLLMALAVVGVVALAYVALEGLKWLVWVLLPEETWDIVGWTTVVGAVVLAVVPLVLWVQWGFRPLRRAAVAVTEGDLSHRAPVVRGTLAEPVAAAFNAMADRVEYTIREQEHLLQLLAHEARTPLARMRFSVATAGAPDADTRAQALDELDGDITELEGLIHEILDALDAANLAIDPAPVLAEEVLLDAMSRVEISDAIQVNLAEIARDAEWVLARPAGFRRVMLNLISNAARHARGQIDVIVRREGEVVVIRVDDDGPGIAPDAREGVFRPFVQLDRPSRDRSGGLGLGLTIANRICDHHGWPIEVGESAVGGASFRTRWAPAPASGDAM